MASAATKKIVWRTTKPRSLWGDAARTFVRNRAGILGLVIVVAFFFVAIFAPWLAPYDYLAQDLTALRQPPSPQHLAGTDQVGRDVFSRILMSVRTAILIAIILTALSTFIGVTVGAFATFLGGWIDQALVWVIDALMNFPGIWLAAFVSVSTRPTFTRWAEALYKATGWVWLHDAVVLDYLVVFGCLALVGWPGMARLVRGQVLSLREKEFIEAQRAIGASAWWITTKHIVPNVAGSVIVAISAGFGGAMLAEASLSFLGLGIRPPGASLGTMISFGAPLWRSDPHLVLVPGLVLSLAVLGFNLMGDALNDALNPRARQR